jgi:uncharacterized ion transporter superfamily protein YfcC
MIIYGYPITSKITKRIVVIIIITIIGIISLSCSKVEFDPKTSLFKHILMKKD